MSLPPVSPTPPRKAVLGLFADESEFRDHLAAHLDLIEPGLTVLDTEYELTNPDGAGGRVDILARDDLRHIVCIEVKRSDNSARATLNELSKYVTLLVARDRVPREIIRCIVVSTDWHELLLPLSYFAQSTGVDTIGLKAIRAGDDVALERQALLELRFLPQFSPDMDMIWFDDPGPRDRTVDLIRERSPDLPFVRIAVIEFERIDQALSCSPFVIFICVWRVAPEHGEAIETVIGREIGMEAPYVAPGWEREADAKNWMWERALEEVPEVAHGWTHGTPEKLHAIQPNYRLTRVNRIGDWPRSEIINDDPSILEAALATSPLGGTERANRHSFRRTISPLVSASWRAAVSGFLDFIAFEPGWRDTASRYLAALDGTDVRVELHGFDKKHFFYTLHQAQAHEGAMLGYFEIIVRVGDEVIDGLHGHYVWDGTSPPADAVQSIERSYGSLTWGVLSLGSAVDVARYENALTEHGFRPIVDHFDGRSVATLTPLPRRSTLDDFVSANPAYCCEVSAALESLGPLPTDPSA